MMDSGAAGPIKSNPIKQRWGESKTRSFILSYLSKPELWDTNCQSYTQKQEKQQAYTRLMDDFGLSISEVKTKIRILRTTYSQERKKEETIPNYVPKLSWYADMKHAFGGGKVKSFSKVKRENVEQAIIKKEDTTDPLVQIEYEEEEEEEEEYDNEDVSLRPEEDGIAEHTTAHVIVEPYDDDESYSNQIVSSTPFTTQKYGKLHQMPDSNNATSSSSMPSQSNSKSQTLLSSNELFLQSLRSSLDQLSDEKNMRARIKIQEILYQILYEMP